jgi:uncharacterized protein YacL
MDIHKIASFLKKTAKVNVAIGLLLSMLASALIQVVIPGSTLLEVILSVIVTVIFAYLAYRKDDTKGLVAKLYAEGHI